MANYEPATIKTLANVYSKLQDKGVNAWYGEAGEDVGLAKLILEGASVKEAYDYCLEMGYSDQEDEDQ